jgi:hypothetical protein
MRGKSAQVQERHLTPFGTPLRLRNAEVDFGMGQCCADKSYFSPEALFQIPPN